MTDLTPEQKRALLALPPDGAWAETPMEFARLPPSLAIGRLLIKDPRITPQRCLTSAGIEAARKIREEEGG